MCYLRKEVDVDAKLVGVLEVTFADTVAPLRACFLDQEFALVFGQLAGGGVCCQNIERGFFARKAQLDLAAGDADVLSTAPR